jgi:type IV pilus assembly protein PilP
MKMKIFRMRRQQWVMLLLAGLVMAGYPCPTMAMSLFMGGEEPKQSAPPSKAVVGKPQPSAGQPGAKAAGPAVSAPAQAVPAKPGPVATAPGPVTAPATGAPVLPATTPSVTGQPASAPVTGSKPVTAQPPTPPAQAVGSATEAPKPAASPVAPIATTSAQSAQTLGSAKEAPKPAASTVTPPIAAVAPASSVAEGYTYDPKSRRDPFQSLTRLVKIDRTRMELPPLQRVQLSDLKLMGIIWGGYGYFGLVRTPDGKGYTVKEGMLMGTNNGVISAITDKTVTVSEPSIDIAGNKSTKDVVILLRPKEVS